VHATAAAWGGRYHHWSYHHWGRYHHAGRNHGATVVDATVITVATASAVRAAMPTGAATAGDRNGDSGLRLVEWCLWHGLRGCKTKDADADDDEERINRFHLFLL